MMRLLFEPCTFQDPDLQKVNRGEQGFKMLPAPPRTASGRRVYGPAEKRTLAFIRRSRDLGFTLEEIRALLALGGPERAPCADVHKIASAHLENVRKKLTDLVKLESILAETVAHCSDGATPDCPVLDILDAGRPT
jgi:MerR family transcriptional regulator, mercuric resistance operon regulatory protein